MEEGFPNIDLKYWKGEIRDSSNFDGGERIDIDTAFSVLINNRHKDSFKLSVRIAEGIILSYGEGILDYLENKLSNGQVTQNDYQYLKSYLEILCDEANKEEEEEDYEYSGYEDESEGNYQFFIYKEEREDVYKFSAAIAEHLKEQNIPNLVITDRSSRPLYIGVREYWKKKYPDKKMPNIYFMNPRGFKSAENLTGQDIVKIISDNMFSNDAKVVHDQARNHGEIYQDFKQTYKTLLKDKNKPVLVFDTCIHSGNTLKPVKDMMKEQGFTDIRIGSINPSGPHSSVNADFYITNERPARECIPFDKDCIVEKTFDHVYSTKTKDKAKRSVSIALRKEIKRIMQEYCEELV